jgi:outer membrane protein TolC
MIRIRSRSIVAAGVALAALGSMEGCAAPAGEPAARRPSVAPATRPAGGELALAGARADPMYRELLAIDLPAVAGVANARSLDVRQARERVEAARGRYQSSWGAFFPVLSPSVGFEHVEGQVRAVNGPLLGADFSSLAPAALVQWAINPGKVYYDVVASRKRLEASEHQERQVQQETLRVAVVQYYDLVLAQARLAAAHRAVGEGEELLRITRLRLRAGAGLEADALRAEADLSRRQQDLAVGLGAFYEASVALAVTLHMDATVTLVPRPERVPQLTLVRPDLGIDEMMGLAVAWRSDLRGVRTLIAAAAADRGSAAWGGLGPQVQVGYQYGGIASDTPEGLPFSLKEQRRLSAGVGWTFGLAVLGQLKTAGSAERLAALEGERQLDVVKAQVVRAAQSGTTQAKLIPMAARQVAAAESALGLAQASLRAGTTLTIDVLQAADAVDQARLRYADAVVRFNQAQVNLLAALGLIDAEALAVVPAGADANAASVADPGPASQPSPATQPAPATAATQ